MKLTVKNDRLIVVQTKEVYPFEEIEYAEPILDIDIKELARLLKPYIDSISNCECGKK
jgi:hypothetical protein